MLPALWIILLWAAKLVTSTRWQQAYEGPRRHGVVYVFSNSTNSSADNSPIADKCHGVIVGPKFVLTPCTCVTTTKNPNTELRTPWIDPKEEEPLSELPASRFIVSALSKPPVANSSNARYFSKVSKIRIHPRCTNKLIYDMAGLFLERDLPHQKVEWIHTVVRALFTVDLKKLEIASTVIPRCVVVTSRGGPDAAYMIPVIRKVSFQNWHLCIPKVCPLHVPVFVEVTKEKKTCFRQQNDMSWWCLEPLSDMALCSLPHGTPVFCDYVGEQAGISGLIGFLDTQNAICPYDNYEMGVMIGLDVALGYKAFTDNIEKEGHVPLLTAGEQLSSDPI